MEFNFSQGAVINAGGAFLFLLAGLAILAVARRTRLGLRLGAFATTFGFAYAASNLLLDEGPVAGGLLLASHLATCGFLGVLIGEVLRPLPAGARRRIVVLAAGISLGVAVALTGYVAYLLEIPGRQLTGGAAGGFLAEFVIEPMLLILLAASSQAPAGGSLQLYKGRLLVGLAAGLFAVDIIMFAATVKIPEAGWMYWAADGVGLLVGALVAVTAWLVLRGRPPGAERFARRAFVAIVLVGLAGCLQRLVPGFIDDFGPFGLLRSAGAVLLVLAVVRYDVLEIPLPRLILRRGTLAGAALAVLFIVAQVAQNFFTAKFPLLVGGILAGAFVFAASPIQRAIERASGQPQMDRAVAGYKAALRAAMRDGTLTRREERHLAEVAVALGISPIQALDLRDEVEREPA